MTTILLNGTKKSDRHLKQLWRPPLAATSSSPPSLAASTQSPSSQVCAEDTTTSEACSDGYIQVTVSEPKSQSRSRRSSRRITSRSSGSRSMSPVLKLATSTLRSSSESLLLLSSATSSVSRVYRFNHRGGIRPDKS